MVQIIQFFLEDVQIIYSISLHFFKPYISKIYNGLLLLLLLLYNLKFNWF